MVVLVAVAPAVWRNWAAIRLALGRIYSDFRDYPAMVTFIPQHCGGRECSGVDFSKYWKARCSALFGEKQHPPPWSRRVARLNWLLFDKLPTDEIFIYPAMGDDGRRPAAYLLQQYISPALVALS